MFYVPAILADSLNKTSKKRGSSSNPKWKKRTIDGRQLEIAPHLAFMEDFINEKRYALWCALRNLGAICTSVWWSAGLHGVSGGFNYANLMVFVFHSFAFTHVFKTQKDNPRSNEWEEDFHHLTHRLSPETYEAFRVDLEHLGKSMASATTRQEQEQVCESSPRNAPYNTNGV